jgi:hypothetical protein
LLHFFSCFFFVLTLILIVSCFSLWVQQTHITSYWRRLYNLFFLNRFRFHSYLLPFFPPAHEKLSTYAFFHPQRYERPWVYRKKCRGMRLSIDFCIEAKDNMYKKIDDGKLRRWSTIIAKQFVACMPCPLFCDHFSPPSFPCSLFRRFSLNFSQK